MEGYFALSRKPEESDSRLKALFLMEISTNEIPAPHIDVVSLSASD